MDNPSSATCSTCGSWWRLPLLLALLLGGILLSRGRNLRESERLSDPPPSIRQSDEAAERVSLTINFADGRLEDVQHIGWHEGMTVRDALQKAGGVTVRQQGSGASAFLTQINGVANEGAAGRNWTYSVNGRRGDRSFALYELRPGDRVLWSFEPTQ